jgi:hypothetical protein
MQSERTDVVETVLVREGGCLCASQHASGYADAVLYVLGGSAELTEMLSI